jgi:ArsR family transcriptional regulator
VPKWLKFISYLNNLAGLSVPLLESGQLALYIWKNVYSDIHMYRTTPMLNPAAVFKCLSDETRARATLLITREGELCVCELVCALDDSQPKISRHLAQLRGCGLLLDRRQGQWVYYRLNPDLPAWVRDVLQTTLAANVDWLEQNSTRLNAMGDRPLNTSACC